MVGVALSNRNKRFDTPNPKMVSADAFESPRNAMNTTDLISIVFISLRVVARELCARRPALASEGARAA
jgi:hypothetical protein